MPQEEWRFIQFIVINHATGLYIEFLMDWSVPDNIGIAFGDVRFSFWHRKFTITKNHTSKEEMIVVRKGYPEIIKASESPDDSLEKLRGRNHEIKNYDLTGFCKSKAIKA
ncbi:unnamed protein product [Microthlaspi erraticum]|uniref:Uncharacterized protein n=1 Tax=Microthlaspi erraticum TaxID=1685480 RepID=A0A6D2KN04_9BRAS|nr:unnamed protein product [Microthlaspi erraticum]